MNPLFQLRTSADSEALHNELSLLINKAMSVQRCAFDLCGSQDDASLHFKDVNTLVAVTEALLCDMQQISEELISRKLKGAQA